MDFYQDTNVYELFGHEQINDPNIEYFTGEREQIVAVPEYREIYQSGTTRW